REFDFGRCRARVDHAEELLETYDAKTRVGIAEMSWSCGVIAEHDDGREKVEFVEAGPYSLEPFLVDEEYRRARVAESVNQLVRSPPRVKGHDDRARDHRAPKAHDPFGRVARGQGDPIALVHPEVDQPFREGGRDSIVLIEGKATIFVNEEVARRVI